MGSKKSLEMVARSIEESIQRDGIKLAGITSFEEVGMRERLDFFNLRHSPDNPVSIVEFLELYRKIAISHMNDFCGLVEKEIQKHKVSENPPPPLVIRAFGFDQHCQKVHREMVITPVPETAETCRTSSGRDDFCGESHSW